MFESEIMFANLLRVWNIGLIETVNKKRISPFIYKAKLYIVDKDKSEKTAIAKIKAIIKNIHDINSSMLLW